MTNSACGKRLRRDANRSRVMMKYLAATLMLVLVPFVQGQSVATTQEAVSAKLDLWGEAALRRPGGPTYEFFERLLPPLRYVDTNFRVYPIALSAPNAPVKIRLVGN